MQSKMMIDITWKINMELNNPTASKLFSTFCNWSFVMSIVELKPVIDQFEKNIQIKY